jgi:ribosomal 50S subunit-associated protein YjgA (DUF615 family)
MESTKDEVISITVSQQKTDSYKLAHLNTKLKDLLKYTTLPENIVAH